MTAPEYNPPGSSYPPGQQQQGPYGPPQGQGQYGGPPPGQPGQPGQYGGPPQGQYGGGMPPEPPKKSFKTRRIVALVILLAVVIVVVVFALKAAKSNPDAAKIGDCVSKGAAEDIKVVNCTSPNAAYKVVGKVEHKTQVDFDLSSATICKPYPTAQSAFWKGKVGEAGYVLCLAPAK